MTIAPEKIDRVHFAQFLKLIYLNAVHCATRRGGGNQEMSVMDRIVGNFVTSLYPSKLDIKCRVDSHILQHILQIMNFIEGDLNRNELIPLHSFINRLEQNISPGAFHFILSRYQAMTCLYYELYSDSTIFTLGGGLLPENVAPLSQMVTPSNISPTENTPNTILRSQQTDPSVTTMAQAQSVSATQRQSAPVPSGDQPRRGRGRPRKTDTVAPTPVTTQPVAPILEEEIVEDQIIEETQPQTQALPKRRGRPPKNATKTSIIGPPPGTLLNGN